MLTNLTFELKFSFSNGAMRVVIEDNRSVLLDLNDVTDESVKHSITINLPSKLTFTLSGKGRADTKMDENNNITADKYVILTSMALGNIPIQHSKLYEICNYSNTNGFSKDTFWAFNGQVVIDFDEADFIKWHLKNSNIFDFIPTELTYV